MDEEFKISLDDAFKKTLEKWEKVEKSLDGFFDLIDEVCGFCDRYAFWCNKCEARAICRESARKMEQIKNTLVRQVTKNLVWIREEMKNNAD